MAPTNEQLIRRLALVLTSLREVASLPDRLCEAGRQMLSADGAAITLSSGDARIALCATDETSMVLLDLQEVVEQGPVIDSLDTANVEIAAFDDGGDGRWSMLHEQGSSLGFSGTLIAVPLRIDDHVIGVLSAHRKDPGTDADRTIGSFLGVAVATALMQDAELGLAEHVQPLGWPSQAQIHQATGMIVAQVGVLPEDALALLKGQAFAQNTTLVAVAEQIIERRINFRHFTIEGD